MEFVFEFIFSLIANVIFHTIGRLVLYIRFGKRYKEIAEERKIYSYSAEAQIGILQIFAALMALACAAMAIGAIISGVIKLFKWIIG